MKPTQQKNILIIAIPSAILILAWIIFGVYNKSVTSTISALQNLSILPIAPTFEAEFITQLREREVITPTYTADEAAVNPVDEGEETIATPSAQPTPSLPLESDASPEADLEGELP